jgi:hypothetical protein
VVHGKIGVFSLQVGACDCVSWCSQGGWCLLLVGARELRGLVPPSSWCWRILEVGASGGCNLLIH